MPFQVANNLRFRRSFGRIKRIIDLPYLIEIQKNSYELFLQKDSSSAQRENIGLQEVFKSVFPIKDFNETASLEFVSYSLGEPKYDVDECHQRGMTFAAPLKVTVQLVLWDVDAQTGARSIKNVKEQEVYFGEIPLMTKNGTFMVNGTERVIVSQLHRSPGVFSNTTREKRTQAASCSIRRGLSPTAVPGSISSLIHEMSFMSVSIAVVSFTPRSC
jgi:DNA-directed RNA polymerase subunit beta